MGVSGGAGLRVRVLTGLTVEGFSEHALGSRKARTTLTLLAIASNRPVSAARIADALWGDRQPRDPAGQLAVIISRLRRVLGAERITHADTGYTLHLDWLDLTAATELVAEAERRLIAGNPAAALAAATSARELLAHVVLDDDAWRDHERREVARLTARSRHLVARVALGAGDMATGVESAEQAIDTDPYDEEALRLAMAGLAAQGRASSALALYERIRTVLDDELGTSPSEATDAAHRAVLKGLPVPGIDVAVHAHRDGASPAGSLTGRAEELQTLHAAFSAVSIGTPQVVVIEGEPGIGKTALVAAWLGGLDPTTRVLDTRCDQLSRSLPLQPALHMLRTFLRRAGTTDARALLGADTGLLEPVMNWRRITVAEDDDAAQVLASSPAGIAVIFAALARVVARACTSPSVLFVDDIQRADSLTCDWIADLARTPDLPLLIVLTRRSGEGAVPAGARIMTLTPITVDAVALIVGAERAADLHRRSGGNPLFLTALASADPDADLPESIRSAVVARCAEAEGDAGAIRDAAVLGTRIDVDLLAHVLKMEPIPLLGKLETGIRLQLLEDRDGSYVFCHEVVREALDASVGSPRRALLHRDAARILITQPGADPMLIAHHARLSGAHEIAAEALTAASRIATERFDYGAALAYADEAIAARDITPARLQRATVLLYLARYDDAQRDADVAVDHGDDIRAYDIAGSIAYYCRDFSRAAALGSALIDEAVTPMQRVQGHVIRARAFHAEGEVTAAHEQLVAADRICTTHRLRHPASVSAWLSVQMGEPAAALAALDSIAAGANETISTIYTPVHAHFIRGYALATCGRGGEALLVLERASEEAHRRGLARYESLGANMSSWVHRNIGDVARAQECNRIAREGARAVGHRELEVYAVLDPCDDDLAGNDVASARARVAIARELMRERYEYAWRHRLRVRLIEARIALLDGMPEAALENAALLIADAAVVRAPRYARLGEVVGWQAKAMLGLQGPSDADLHELSDGLATVAGLEAWWLLGEVGAACGSGLSFQLAAAHRDRVTANLAGDAQERFASYAGTRLERMSTRKTTA